MLSRPVKPILCGFCALLFAVFLIAGFGSTAGSTAETQSTAKAGQDPQQAAIEKKLKDVLKNQEQIIETQKQILQKFDAVMEELRIVKVRVSLHSN